MFGGNGIKLFKLFGTELRLHPLWFCIFLLVSLPHVIAGNISAAIVAAGIITLVYVSVVGHEFAHLLTARYRYGIKCERVVIHIFGGAAMLERIPFGVPEIVIALAGPAFSAIVGVTLCLPFVLGVEATHPVLQTVFVVGYINCILAFFNVLPIFPMDGGRVFRGLLFILTKKIVTSTRVVVFGGLVVVLPVVFMIGVLPLTLWTIFIVFVIASLGMQELKHVELLYHDELSDPNSLDPAAIHLYWMVTCVLGPGSPDAADARKFHPDHVEAFDLLDKKWKALPYKEKARLQRDAALSLARACPNEFLQLIQSGTLTLGQCEEKDE